MFFFNFFNRKNEDCGMQKKQKKAAPKSRNNNKE